MRLRTRLVATCVIVAVPVVVAVGIAQRDARNRTIDGVLSDQIDGWLAMGPTRCDEGPPGRAAGFRFAGGGPPGLIVHGELPFGGPPPFPPPPPGVPPPGAQLTMLWVQGYDDAFVPLSFDAPPLDPALIGRARRSGIASRSVVIDGRAGRELLRRIPPLADGCTWIVSGRLLPDDSSDPGLVPWFVASLLAPLVVWAAMGNPVARLRALTTAVRASAADRYRTPAAIGGHDEVGDLGRAFDEAAAVIRSHIEQVEDREQVLRRFVADTTHDLMTPLTVLQGEIAGLEATTGAPALALAAREAQYLASIIHNLATVARLDVQATTPVREPFDLGDVVDRVVRRHEPLARRLGVSFGSAVPADPLWVDGEAVLVEQALSNVVHNAIRHNRAGGHAALVLDITDDGFVVRVHDDGPGVTDDELARLTERAWRSTEARTRHPDGQGLGLTITRRVFDRHGWTLTLDHVDGGGLAVEVRGPVTVREA